MCIAKASSFYQVNMRHKSVFSIFIDREAGEIIRLVASVCLSVCPSVSALTLEHYLEQPHKKELLGKMTVQFGKCGRYVNA